MSKKTQTKNAMKPQTVKKDETHEEFARDDRVIEEEKEAAAKAAEEAAGEENAPALPDYASDDSAEYAAELNNEGKLSTAAIAEIKGSGKDGAITKKDLDKAVTAESKKAAKAEEESAPAEDEKEEEAEEEIDYTNPKHLEKVLDTLLDDVVSLGLPLRGALHAKPKVQERWNKVVDMAVKLKRVKTAGK